MLRIVALNILPGMLVTACVIGICAATVEAQDIVLPDSKQMYSNRAIGFTLPTPYYGTPMMPIFIPPPGAPPFMGPPVPPFMESPEEFPFMGPPGAPPFMGPPGAPPFMGPQGAPPFMGPQGAPPFMGPQGAPPFMGQQGTPSRVQAAAHTDVRADVGVYRKRAQNGLLPWRTLR